MEERLEKVVESMNKLVKEQEEFNLLMAQTLGSIIILLDGIRQNGQEEDEFVRKIAKQIENAIAKQIENAIAKTAVENVTKYLEERL